ncbi:hypothetical protein AGMMS49940_20950 [Spirochaetia bacterium]|nr:hypothetical protein AGMMS49940_20950 [Spirochaetia bacterium]
MKKFMNRTTGLAALYGFIVGAAVLFAACSNLVSPSSKAGIATEPGTGQVQVSIAGEDFAPAASVRTIFPTQPTLSYKYTFTKAGATPQVMPYVDGTFTLVTGNWNLTVDAYLEAAHTNLVATGSTAAAFTVTEGVSTPVSVTLEPVTSTGTGTLTYTVTYPAGATLDSLTWKKLGGAVLPNFDVTSFNDDGLNKTLLETGTPVAAGYYVITAALTDGGGKTAGKMEVVHIYQNLTSDVTLTFVADDFTLFDPTPPAEVSSLTATAGNTEVVLTWTDPADSDFDKVVITFSPEPPSGTSTVDVAAGTQTATITGLTNGTAYTFTVKTVDTLGNTSAGTPATATPVVPITYTVTVDGNVVTASTKIDFVFNAAVTGLTDGDITIAGPPGAATKGTLTENDSTHWSLTLTVTTPGLATVAISKTGIESVAKSITLHGGLTFTAGVATAAFSSSDINGVTYGNGKFVAVGANGKIGTSSDGATWAAATTITPAFGGSNSIRGVTYGGTTFVAVGNGGEIGTSTDGATWAAATSITPAFGSVNIFGVTYDGTTFVAVGAGKIGTSADNGATWTAATSSPTFGSTTNDYIFGVTYGNGTFVAVGTYGKIGTSTDGATWTAATSSPMFGSSSSDQIRGVTYGGGKFVAVGQNGKIATSTDGTTWTERTQSVFTGSNDNIYGVSYGGGKFVAVGVNGKIAASADGVTWTAVTTTGFGGSNNIWGVTYGNGKFVAVGANGRIAYSNPQE